MAIVGHVRIFPGMRFAPSGLRLLLRTGKLRCTVRSLAHCFRRSPEITVESDAGEILNKRRGFRFSGNHLCGCPHPWRQLSPRTGLSFPQAEFRWGPTGSLWAPQVRLLSAQSRRAAYLLGIGRAGSASSHTQASSLLVHRGARPKAFVQLARVAAR